LSWITEYGFGFLGWNKGDEEVLVVVLMYGHSYFFFFFYSLLSLFSPLFFAGNGHSYLYEVGKMCGLPSGVKSQLLSPLGLITIIDNMPTNGYSQTRLSKVG
jgi:hypothetical protein